MRDIALAERTRPMAVYGLMVILGAAAFLYPFWIPSEASVTSAHSGDAPLVAAGAGALVIVAVLLEVRRGTMTGATVAVLGVLCAFAGLARIVDLPGNNAGMLFLVVLGGAAFGPRFGLLLGAMTMVVSAFITGGVGPWLPFQMLALSWMGGSSGLVGRVTVRLPPLAEVVVLSGWAWIWGFAYGAVMNLWSWPFQRGGALSWEPGLSTIETLDRYWSFYVATSLGWDAATALFNAVLVLVTGRVLLTTLRRFAHRLDPVTEFAPTVTGLGRPFGDKEATAVLRSDRDMR